MLQTTPGKCDCVKGRQTQLLAAIRWPSTARRWQFPVSGRCVTFDLIMCGGHSRRTFSSDSIIPRPPFSLCHHSATTWTKRLDRCVRWEPAGKSHSPQGHYQLTAHNEWLVVYVVSLASLGPRNKPTHKARQCAPPPPQVQNWWWWNRSLNFKHVKFSIWKSLTVKNALCVKESEHQSVITF